MPSYRASVVVPNPPREALAFVADLRHAEGWDPRVVRARKVTEAPVAVGTRFVLSSRAPWGTTELPYEVEALEPGRRAVVAGRNLWLRYRDEIGCETVALAGGEEATRLTYDASLSLRGPLALGNLLLRFLLRRIGDEALDGIRRALTAKAQDGGAEPESEAEEPRGDPRPAFDVSPGRVREIVAMDDRPVLRNLLITQSYHELSERLAGMLGRDNLNWCTYATWASRTAGAFIRGDELRRELALILERKRGLRTHLRHLRAALASIHPDAARLGFVDLEEVAEEVIAEIGMWIQGGNTIVFAELGGVFADFVAAFEGATAADAAELEAFVARLTPGDPEPDAAEIGPDGRLTWQSRGGQGLLRRAVAAYHAALFESDPRRKAELVLLGNALGGLHEQTRLQTFIAGSLAAPVDETLFSRRNDALAERLAQDLLGPAQEILHRLFAPVGAEILEAAREVSTLYLMRMEIPGEVLELGSDVPVPAGAGPWPPGLDPLHDPDLLHTLRRYGAYGRLAGPRGPLSTLRRWMLRALVALRLHRPVIFGSAAEDWGDLAERMRYIFVYFRSRQASADHFQPPFSVAEEAALAAGRLPERWRDGTA